MRVTPAAALLLASLLVPACPVSGQQPDRPASKPAALTLSLAGTLAPIAAGAVFWASQGDEGLAGGYRRGPERVAPAMIMASGVVLGPALGYWYGGRVGRGFLGVGLRTGLLAASFVPAMAICGWDCGVGDSGYDLAWLVVAAGSGLGLASAAWDILHVRGAVRESGPRGGDVSITASPIWMGRGRGAGVGVHVRW